jgi:hypothetical protein
MEHFYPQETSKFDIGYKPLGIEEMSATFVTVFIMCTLAFVVFLVEMHYDKVHRESEKRRCEEHSMKNIVDSQERMPKCVDKLCIVGFNKHFSNDTVHNIFREKLAIFLCDFNDSRVSYTEL